MRPLPPENVEFRELDWLPDHRIGADGTVLKLFKSYGWRVRKVQRSESTKWYEKFEVFINGRRRKLYVHRLVLEAFRGPCPPGMEACHCNGNPGNNRVENLRWDTRVENRLDQERHGTMACGIKKKNAKLTDDLVRQLRSRFAQGATKKGLAKEFGVSRHVVRTVLEGKAWRHVA